MSSLITGLRNGLIKGLCGLLAWTWSRSSQTTSCLLLSEDGLGALLEGAGETGAVKW